MKVGIPKGLLYYKYYPFYIEFFNCLGAEVVLSLDTNKGILNEGIKYCVDEACVPVKVFHGHCAYLKDKCDLIFIPRIMKVYKEEFICPKFCGLGEMVLHSIPNMPKAITEPIYGDSKKNLKKWAFKVGNIFTKKIYRINNAFESAFEKQEKHVCGINDYKYPITIALVGHPYNIFDEFINLNLIKKLNSLGIGIMTENYVDISSINERMNELYKKPFWTFARNSYGFASYVYDYRSVEGIIYVSSFACGIDSVVIELIKDKVGEFPFLELKLDEQSGEAGFDTRIEAFTDMLKRKADLRREMA